MAHFTTNGKQYPDGTIMPSFAGLDLTAIPAGTTIAQTAPPVLQDSTNNPRSFLFWDTGRRITNKRTVHWTFNHPENWSEWKAVAWYGVGNGTEPTVTANAYWIGSGPIDPTPIDGPGSTFVNGPGGTPVAWPWMGNDHQVRTEFGAATIHAKAHVQKSASDPSLNFSSWTWLVLGGDSSSYFDENDDNITSGSGVLGMANQTSPDFAAPKGSGGVLLGAYAAPGVTTVGPGIFEKLQALLTAISIGKYIDKGDPSPEDIIRLKLISESLDLVRGQHVTGDDAFAGLVGAAAKMSPAQLKSTIVETRATLLRGQAALRAIEGMAKTRVADKTKKRK